MANDQKTISLPDNEQFWGAVDNLPTREYYSTMVFEMIRGESPKDETERIQFIAKLQLMVGLLDSPPEVYKSIVLSKLEEADRKELEDTLQD